MPKHIFVVMPAYNAEKTIEKVFSRIPDKTRKRVHRFVVVNDGSTDNTKDAIKRLCTRYPNLTPLNHSKNRGYGAAEKTLLNFALKEGADVAVLLHADGQYSPEKISNLLNEFENGNVDLVQGSRMLNGGALKGGMPIYKFMANKCLTSIENYTLKMKMAEYHSGYMAYSRKTLSTIPFNKLSESFEFDLEMIVMAKIKGLEIVEVPIPTIYRDEISHLKPIQYGINVLSVMLAYKRGKYHSL